MIEMHWFSWVLEWVCISLWVLVYCYRRGPVTQRSESHRFLTLHVLCTDGYCWVLPFQSFILGIFLFHSRTIGCQGLVSFCLDCRNGDGEITSRVRFPWVQITAQPLLPSDRCPKTALKKYHKLGGLKNRNISHSSKVWKSKINVSAGPCPSENPGGILSHLF